jgi:cellulose synthase/poly-beta-1,6-N-acetylglucosamine synthase-like glycosyltransferase
MKVLLLVSSLLTLSSFLLSVMNFFTMRSIKELHNDSSLQELKAMTYSLLIPMRNEERNVEGLLRSVLARDRVAKGELIVLDDHSSDSTHQLLQEFGHEITIIQGEELPSGWMGKPFACQQLSQHSGADYLIFIDADVRLSPTAVTSALTFMHRHDWDFLSPYPRQVAPTFLLRPIQPLLQWSWFSTVPLRFAESGRVKSMVVANGQFLIIKASAYKSIGGHAAVKAEVLEDLSLARALVASGYVGGVAEASAVASCRMYESNSEMISGYTKSLWKAFGGPVGSLFTVALITLTQILPLALLISGVSALPFMACSLTHFLSAMKTRSSIVNTILHPLAALILIALICESYRRRALGKLEWRGRRVL